MRLLESDEALVVGLERERSKHVLPVLAIDDDKEFLESKALFQNPKSASSSVVVVLLQLVDVGFVFGGLICKDKSGCAGNSSISKLCQAPKTSVCVCVCVCSALACLSSLSLCVLLPFLSAGESL